MTKLKTLKDLVEEYEIGNTQFINLDIVKQEAIKWVLKVPITKLDVDAWMDFFNITEEDLK